jgi:hypothetical protein
MFVQILCRGGLPMRMLAPQNGTLDGRLPVRECLQVRSSMRLQIQVDGRDNVACCALEPGPAARPSRVRYEVLSAGHAYVRYMEHYIQT